MKFFNLGNGVECHGAGLEDVEDTAHVPEAEGHKRLLPVLGEIHALINGSLITRVVFTIGSHTSSFATCSSRGRICSSFRGPNLNLVQRDCRAGIILLK